MESKSSISNTTSDLELESEEHEDSNYKIFSFKQSDLLDKERYKSYQEAIKQKIEKSKLSYLKVAPQDRVDMSSLCLEPPHIIEEGICDSPRKNKEIKSRLKSIRKKYAESLQLIEEMPVEVSHNFVKLNGNEELRLCLNNSFRKIDFQKLKKNDEERESDKENFQFENLNNKKNKFSGIDTSEFDVMKEEKIINSGKFAEEINLRKMKKREILEEVLTAFEIKEGKIKKIHEAEKSAKKKKFSIKNFKKNYFPSTANSKKKVDKRDFRMGKSRINVKSNEVSFLSNKNISNDNLRKCRVSKYSASFSSKSNLNSPQSKKIKILIPKKKNPRNQRENKKISFNSNRNYKSDKIINLNFRRNNYMNEIAKIVKKRSSQPKMSEVKPPPHPKKSENLSNNKKRENLPFNSPKKKFGADYKKPKSRSIENKSQRIIKKISELKRKSRKKIKKHKSFVTFQYVKPRRISYKSAKKVNSLNISKRVENRMNALSSSKKYTKRTRQNSQIERQIKKVKEFDLDKLKQAVNEIQENRKDQRIELLEETIYQQNELIKKLLGYMKEDKEMKLKDRIEELGAENRELKSKLMEYGAKDIEVRNVR